MFLYNIAFSLEFIVLGLGALMIGWAQYKCAKWKCCEGRYGEGRTTTTTSNITSNVTGATAVDRETRKTHDHGHACGTGMVKGIGTLLIILALANFADTIYNSVRFHQHRHNFREKMQMMRNEYNAGSTTTTTNAPASSTSTAP